MLGLEQADLCLFGGENLEIETIVAYRNVESAKEPHKVLRQELLVKWKDREETDNTWVSKSSLKKDQARAEHLVDAGYLDEEPAVRKAR